MDLDGLFLAPQRQDGSDSSGVIPLVRQWADREIIGKRLDYFQNYPVLFMEKLRVLALSIGLQKLAISEDSGGFGWNTPAHAPGTLNVVTEVGRADASAAVLMAMNYAVFSSVIARASLESPDSFQDITRRYLSEDLMLFSCILPGPGFVGEETPLFKGRSLHAKLEQSPDGFILHGTNLRPLSGGSLAHLFCVICADEKGLPVIALVPADARGLTLSSPITTTGLNACTNSEVTFDKVKLPRENIIDYPGSAEDLLTWLNLLLGGASLGAGLNFFEILSDWCETRVIKGTGLLKENPLCAAVLADVAEELACTKLLLLDLAGIISSESGHGKQEVLFTYAGMIGARAQQSVMRAINRGLELMGSAGYAKEWHAEKHWRDVKTIQSVLCGFAAEAPTKMDTARFFYTCNEI